MAEFWIEVKEPDGGYVAIIHELIVHNQIAGDAYIYDVRFTTNRFDSDGQAFIEAEEQLKGYLSQFGRKECTISRCRRTESSSQ